MADKVKNIEECILQAKNLKASVTKVFQELASEPGTRKDSGDLPEASNVKGANVVLTLKKNLIHVNKILR